MTEDLSSSDIDWNAPIGELDTYYEETEPPPPPNRAIYPLQTQRGWKIIVTPFNPEWASQFLSIKADLHRILSSSNPPVSYNRIEHIGSTSVPNLCAKPNVDVLITFPSQAALESAKEAFDWERPTSPPFIKYTRVPNGGGIQGRESLKLYVPDYSPYYYSTPERSVYLINEDESNPYGRVQIRCYRTVKATLSDPANHDLLEAYANVKMQLSMRIFEDSITYSALKDDIIRKILTRAGWTDEEVDLKERLSQRSLVVDEPAY